jgi:Nif-specific regulatory protein
LSGAVLRALTRYPWPGNVRELQNVMAALAVAAPLTGRVPLSLLPARITAEEERPATLAAARASCERQVVLAALARAGGRRAEAARALGVTRQGLSKLMSRLEVGVAEGGQT